MKLKFKYQQFQQDAVDSVCDVFNGQPYARQRYIIDPGRNNVGSFGQQMIASAEEMYGYGNADIALRDSELLNNINGVHSHWRMPRDGRLDKLNDRLALTVEMETGTGKTYVYIKTILELNKKYGWNKFIVVVPSIAIREGVLKTFQTTADHFRQLYDTQCRFFVYNSTRLADIRNFASDNKVNVMIVNTQAFNARGADARRITMELDDFNGRRPMDVIAQTHPIVIIDEPQSVLGEAKKKNATREQLRRFQPLFYLLYSATHRENFNMVYRLDAVDAYKQKLVKKITVKGVSLVGNTAESGYLYLDRIDTYTDKNPTARVVVEYDSADSSGKLSKRIKNLTVGDNIYDVSGNIEAYRYGYIISDIDAKNDVVRFTGGFELSPGQCRGNTNEDDLRRIQIDETIKSHLERERRLFKRGIKVLSLFFVDEVAKYKQYDDQGNEMPGLYGKLFEMEYERQVESLLNNMAPDDQPNWQEYLRQTLHNISRIHAGYFSIDKKGHLTDGKKKDESDDVSAYDLIMKDKERLLSFDEPVRFIFSHSALREGWDNPNVFQICTLRESSSSIKKRQEIGRGLRLAVDMNGIRQDAELLGNDEVRQVNELTVIANESYDNFARALQDEMQEVIKNRPRAVSPELFMNQIFVGLGNTTLTSLQAGAICAWLIEDGLMDGAGHLSDEYYNMTQDEKVTAVGNAVGDEFAPAANEFVEILDSVFDINREKYISNARNSVQLRLRRDKVMSADFQELWDEIDRKTYYQIDVDDDQLVEVCAERLNSDGITVTVLEAVVDKGSMSVNDFGVNDDVTMVKEASTARQIIGVHSQVKHDLIGEIATGTNLLRTTVYRILMKLRATVFGNYRRNPEEFIRRCIHLINDAKSSLVAENITYYATDDKWDVDEVFDQAITGHIGEDVIEVKKNVYDRLKYDSDVEFKLAEAMELDSDIDTYAKIPTSFKISTPVGNYSPDWAIIAKKTDGTRKVFFVAETKGSSKESDLRGVEKAKIKCAGKHFQCISGGKVRFGLVSDFDELKRELFA